MPASGETEPLPHAQLIYRSALVKTLVNKPELVFSSSQAISQISLKTLKTRGFSGTAFGFESPPGDGSAPWFIGGPIKS
jgi:hypothetical protein